MHILKQKGKRHHLTKRIFQWQSKMKVQLTMVIVLMMGLTVIAIGTINYYNDIQKMVESKKEANLIMAKTVASEVDMYVTDAIRGMKTVIATVDFEHMDAYEKNTTLAKIASNNEQFKAIYMTDLEGNIVATTNAKRDSGQNYQKEAWFQQAMKENIYMSQTFIDQDANIPIIVIALPIENIVSGKTGMMAVDLRLDRLYYLIRNMKIGETGFSYIVDQQGNIIAHPQFKEKVLTKYNAAKNGVLGVQNVIEGKEGVDIYHDTENRKVIGAYFPTTSTNWGILVEQPYHEVIKQGKEALRRTFIISNFFILVSLFVGVIFARIFTRPILDMVKVANQIKDGDLTERIQVRTTNEVGVLQQAFNEMANALANIIKDVHRAAEKVRHCITDLENNAELTAGAVTEITAVMDEVAAGTEKQIVSIKNTTDMVDQMSYSVKRVSENTLKFQKASNQAVNVAQKGAEDIEKMNATIQSIDETVGESAKQIEQLIHHTHQIEDIVQLIKGISDQTNLLALNAAIEAARAGEHGRGFAVVADEIRKLAEQSAKASSNIVSLTETMQNETDHAIKAMEDSLQKVQNGTQIIGSTSQSFYKIIEETQMMAKEVEEFTGAVQQLNVGIDTVDNAIKEVSQISETTASGTQTVLASTEEQDISIRQITHEMKGLSSMIYELEKMVERFVLVQEEVGSKKEK
ncbi:methyl-accepting chemotaxis protein [Clostridiaceae bacterium 35-E11]